MTSTAQRKRPRPAGPASSRPLKLAAKEAAAAASSLSYLPTEGEAATAKPALLNSRLMSADGVRALRAEYQSAAPFPHLHLPSFADDRFLETVRAELATLSYHVKSNDLYEFFQSDDLKGVGRASATHPAVATLRETLYGDAFISAVSKITGIELDGGNVDMSAAVYKRGNYLACHDDHNSTRRVAFIVYLVEGKDDEEGKEGWTAADGGALDLFQKDNAGEHPHEVAKSLVPEWNSFAMFAVTPNSWHRVAEVLSDTKPRITISGWFHGKLKDRPAPAPKPQLRHARMCLPLDEEEGEKEATDEEKESARLAAPGAITNLPADAEVAAGAVNLSDFITPQYLEKETMAEVNGHFCRHSSYMLRNCFRNDAFASLMAVLHGESGSGSGVDGDGGLWERTPCPQRAWHLRAGSTPISKHAVVAQWRQLFLSPEFGAWLRRLTGLTATSGSFEARRFDRGHYTLLDDSQFSHAMTLDVVLGCSKKEQVWSEPHGGYVCYMADEEELLTVPLESNALFLVLRDDGSSRFVKYVNVRAPGSRCDLSAEYAIAPFDGDEDVNGEGGEDSSSGEDVIDSDTDEKTMGYGAQAAMIAGHHMG